MKRYFKITDSGSNTSVVVVGVRFNNDPSEDRYAFFADSDDFSKNSDYLKSEFREISRNSDEFKIEREYVQRNAGDYPILILDGIFFIEDLHRRFDDVREL